MAESKRPVYTDADHDGWDDSWVDKYPNARRDTLSDENGDGTPNFIEMMLDIDPYAKIRPAVVADPRAKIRTEERRRVMRKRREQALAPYVNQGLRDADGRPTTRAAMRHARQKKLKSLAVRYKREDVARQARIDQYLNGVGKSLSQERRRRLKDVVEGRPKFVTPLGHFSARWTGIFPLWPGGLANTGLNGAGLTGAGQTVAMWDLGGVKNSHEQFLTGSSRITNIDNTGSVTDDHATSVATAIAGGGDPGAATPGILNFADPYTNRNRARGSAYGAKVRVYNTQGDLGEMTNLALETNAGIQDIVFSNHSYGEPVGWQKAQDAAESAPWIWHGDPFLGDGRRDYKLGFYLQTASREIDEIVHAADIYLPIWAAGNERSRYDVDESPEPWQDGPVGAGTHHTVEMTGITYSEEDAPFRYSDFHPSIFTDTVDLGTAFAVSLGSLIPEACSKNVLTVGEDESGASRGPTDDLRIKPDIVGRSGIDPGALNISAPDTYRDCRGTSFTAASVTGGMALIRQRWYELDPASEQVLASTWKGLAIATAGGTSAENYFHEAGGQPPLPQIGYGLFDALEAVQTVEADHEGRTAGSSFRIMEFMIGEGEVAKFKIRRIDGLGAHFRVLICWTDPKGPIIPKELDPDTLTLVNDLDLRVVEPSGLEHKPWTFNDIKAGTSRTLIRERDDNERDNVEVVDPDSSAPEFTVTIKPKDTLLNGQPQHVSVIIAGDAEAVIPPFRIVDFGQSDEHNPDIYSVTWQSIPGDAYQIESSSDLTSWQALDGEVVAFGDITTVPINIGLMGDRHFIRIRQLD